MLGILWRLLPLAVKDFDLIMMSPASIILQVPADAKAGSCIVVNVLILTDR